jgi:transcriptional regulator GlxA family with amidase domain
MESDGQGATVLVVDDNARGRSLVSVLLKNGGYTPTAVTDGVIGEPPRCPIDERIQSVLFFILENRHRTFRNSEMARCAGLSISHLHQLFRQQTGSTPRHYIRSVRLQEAKDLLESTSLRIKEISASVGFHDDSHFVRDFERLFGISPARYRLQFMLNLSVRKP